MSKSISNFVGVLISSSANRSTFSTLFVNRGFSHLSRSLHHHTTF